MLFCTRSSHALFLFAIFGLIHFTSTLAAPIDISVSTSEVVNWFEEQFDGSSNSSLISEFMDSEGISGIEAQWQAKAECYALPTGIIAWISLILTGWTIYCHSADRKPYKFWSKDRLEHGIKGIILSVLTGAITIPLPAFIAYRCRGDWQLICISAYKLANVVALTCAGLHRSLEVRRKNRPGQGKRELSEWWMYFWMLLYTASFLAGNTGLFNVISKTVSQSYSLKVVVIVCAGVCAGATALLVVLFTVFKCLLKKYWNWMAFLGLLTGIVLFCSGSLNEYTLAVLKRDLVGIPTSGKAAIPYWIFFAGKRLLLLNS